LTYDKPAAESTDGSPVGKGSVGATVFGGANEDRIQFNHGTLWTGKRRSYSRTGAVEYLQQVRRLLFDGKQKETEQLAAAQFMSRAAASSSASAVRETRLRHVDHRTQR